MAFRSYLVIVDLILNGSPSIPIDRMRNYLFFDENTYAVVFFQKFPQLLSFSFILRLFKDLLEKKRTFELSLLQYHANTVLLQKPTSGGEKKSKNESCCSSLVIILPVFFDFFLRTFTQGFLPLFHSISQPSAFSSVSPMASSSPMTYILYSSLFTK